MITFRRLNSNTRTKYFTRDSDFDVLLGHAQGFERRPVPNVLSPNGEFRIIEPAQVGRVLDLANFLDINVNFEHREK